MPIYIIHLCTYKPSHIMHCKDMQRQLHDALAHSVMESNHNDISWVKAKLLSFKMFCELEIPLSMTCILLCESSCLFAVKQHLKCANRFVFFHQLLGLCLLGRFMPPGLKALCCAFPTPVPHIAGPNCACRYSTQTSRLQSWYRFTAVTSLGLSENSPKFFIVLSMHINPCV